MLFRSNITRSRKFVLPIVVATLATFKPLPPGVYVFSNERTTEPGIKSLTQNCASKHGLGERINIGNRCHNNESSHPSHINLFGLFLLTYLLDSKLFFVNEDLAEKSNKPTRSSPTI